VLLAIGSGLLLAQNYSIPAAYDQPYRPQYHFSPREHWTNDPNGLVYFEGEYHLFFQYNPFGDHWGHMTWGHAVSQDLLHWKQLPPAIPEGNGIMIFTGSTVVDEHNLSGFCTNGKPCMVAIYTGHTPQSNGHPALQTQNLAYSNDHGRTWTKYARNPVLDLHMSDFRDPKVFWSRQAARWVMVVSLPNDHKVRIYGSPDLKHWSALSDFGPAGATDGQWECPELFELPLEGKPGEMRWVLKIGLNPGARQGGSGEQYFIGRFDGTRFINDNPVSQTMWTDYGKDCYCALTFNNLPPGRPTVMIGWMSNWQYAKDLPTTPWRGQMTFPRSLTLRMTRQGWRLIQVPLELRGFETAPGTGSMNTVNHWLATSKLADGHTFQIDAAIPLGSAQEVGLRILSGDGSYTLIGYERKRQTLFFDRTHSGLTRFSKDFPGRTEAPLLLEKPVLKLSVLVDRNSVEIFTDEGVASTNLVFPPASANGIEFYAKGGEPGDVSVDADSIPSIWAMQK
jgi:sucrose-6-phosphate hydrolase SacC (GH32 family)